MRCHALFAAVEGDVAPLGLACRQLALSRRRPPPAREACEHCGRRLVPLIAVNDVLYHVPERRVLQDVVTCIREHRDAGGGRPAAGGQCRAASEVRRGDGAIVSAGIRRPSRRRHASSSAAVSRSKSSSTEYPERNPQRLCNAAGGAGRLDEGGEEAPFPNGVPRKFRARLNEELRLIGELNCAASFLTVHEIVSLRDRKESLPGPRLGRQFVDLLLPRHHRRQPGRDRSAVRALHVRGAPRAARHRCRFRA